LDEALSKIDVLSGELGYDIEKNVLKIFHNS